MSDKRKQVPDKVLRDAMRGSVPQGKLRGAKIAFHSGAKGAPIAGCVKYVKGKDQVQEALLPRGNGAFETSVFEHESSHASVSGAKTARPKAIRTEQEESLRQFVEDCVVEGLSLPRKTPEAYRRRRLVPAFRDMRAIMRNHRKHGNNSAAKSPENRNSDLLVGARCLAIARSYGRIYQLEKYWDKINRKVLQVLGELRYAAVDRAVNMLAHNPKKGARQKATDLLLRIMEPENGEDELIEDGPINPRDPNEIIEGVNREKGSLCMETIILKPAGASTAREKALSVRYAPNGVLINPARLSSAIINGDSTGLFLRRRKLEAGGVVLIDASGSMGVDGENLQKLCQMIPTATVAFYSGSDGGRGGKLCIYAQKRKRFSGSEAQLEGYILGGNCIDYPALRWLAKMPGPRYMVTDRGFCGGSWGDATATHILLDSMLARRQLNLIPSLYEAFRFFDKSSPGHLEALRMFGAGTHGVSCYCKACQTMANGETDF